MSFPAPPPFYRLYEDFDPSAPTFSQITIPPLGPLPPPTIPKTEYQTFNTLKSLDITPVFTDSYASFTRNQNLFKDPINDIPTAKRYLRVLNTIFMRTILQLFQDVSQPSFSAMLMEEDMTVMEQILASSSFQKVTVTTIFNILAHMLYLLDIIDEVLLPRRMIEMENEYRDTVRECVNSLKKLLD